LVDDGRPAAAATRPPARLPRLRSYLQARCDAGHSVPRLARELGESEWTITKALATLGIVLPPRPQRLAWQRRRHAEERIAVRVAALGFVDVRAYLEDRLIEREQLLVEVAAELAADRRTVRRLLQQVGVTRGRRTARQLATGERSRRVQSVSWQQRRAARLAELGFSGLGSYLRRR
jgi:AraC-like DNA-binding protein